MPTTADKQQLTVLAAAAHPDDIEFGMAGTLLLLGASGAELHMWNLANGSCGTAMLSKDEIVKVRRQEAQRSADIARAELHEPLVDDFQIYYEPDLLAKVAAVVRSIAPDIILAPSPDDYMEDHQNACRLLVTAAFVRGMRNFETDPPVDPIDKDVVIYHAMPHGLCDSMRRMVRPGYYVDIKDVLQRKRLMLSAHQSQAEWLDKSQGMNAYVNDMLDMGRLVGNISGRYEYAEGWRRHSLIGFSGEDTDPLKNLLEGDCWIDPEYERSLIRS